MIVLPSGSAAASTILSVLLLGGVPLLAAPPSLFAHNKELNRILYNVVRRVCPRLLICSSAHELDAAAIARVSPSTICVLGPEMLRCQDLGEERLSVDLPDMNDLAAMQLTSGTTGAPRICVWDQKAVLSALDGMAASMALSESDVCVNWTPLYHDMGLVNNFLLCMARGVPLALLSPQEFVLRPSMWLRTMHEMGGTITWSPNFGFAITTRKSLDSELSGIRLDHVRAFWNAAEKVHWETLSAFHDRFANLGLDFKALKTNFGCAENIGGATFSSLNAAPKQEWIDRLTLERRRIAQVSEVVDENKMSIVSVGRPHPNLTIRIQSRRGRQLSDGRVGEICLESPSVMLRYHQNARETQRVLRGGLLHTGDLGYMRDGELYWVGRQKERITVHGKKIDPSMFERILGSISGLREGCFAAFGIPDEHAGTERLVLAGEVRSDAEESVKDIGAAIRRRCFLELGLTPADVLLVPSGSLAKTSSGKRRHRYFRQLYLAGELENLRLPAETPIPGHANGGRSTPIGGTGEDVR